MLFTYFRPLQIDEMGCNMYAACWRKPQLFMHAGSEGAGDGVSRITDEVAVSGLMVNHARHGVPDRALSSN